VLLIYWAFRANYRAVRAYETVTVTASAITIRQVSHRGAKTELTFNPLWVKLEREADPEFNAGKLYLVSRGRKFVIAGFLSPREKDTFAGALLAALHEAKRGPTRTISA
jgi:uncharacterized membrane protein